MAAFIYIERSACWCEVNGVRHRLEAGDLFILRGADEFAFGHDPRRPVTSLSACLAITQGSEPNILLQRALPRRVRWPARARAAYIAEFEKVLAALGSTAPGREFTAHGAVLQWLGHLLSRLHAPVRGGGQAVQSRQVVDRILHAQRWARERLGSVIMLGEWARAAGMNPVYFGRVFKSETGQPPMTWLNERRLQQAASLLEQTPRTIADIAGECGFANPFYFTRVFQRRFHMPPSSFRKRGTPPRHNPQESTKAAPD
jgi:AraC-like DNA-binding protein